MMMTEEELSAHYQSLSWTIAFHNRESNFDSTERLKAIYDQIAILRRLQKMVEDRSKEIVDLRDEQNDAADYVGRKALMLSVDDAKILTGVIVKNKRDRIVIMFEQGSKTVGSILYLAD
jgi:hypothetical protein